MNDSRKPTDPVEWCVTNNQPFLNGFPKQICGSIRRRLQDVIAAKRRDLVESSSATYAMQFSHVLPADFLHGLSVSQRIRQYCNVVVVFRPWLAQILGANASLSKAVGLVQAWCNDAGSPGLGKNTGALSKGRDRLGMDFLAAANTRVNAWLRARVKAEEVYQGHDGSSVALDDTAANQLEYPQLSGQKPGCGFPVMGIMGVLNHSHGGWEDFVDGLQSAHDAPFFCKRLHCFNPGDIVCADRAFSTYEIKATLHEKGVHALMRLHQTRHAKLDWRKGRRIGKNQRLVIWKKPSP